MVVALSPVSEPLSLRSKVQEVYERLLDMHGEHPRVPRREPMHELISTMLSHRTTMKAEDEAFHRMWERFGSWESIRDAPLGELIESISVVQFAEPKAANIKRVLKTIIEERGEPKIDFLNDLSTEDALTWLVALPGVGVKTASLVLLFCFGKPVIPVDSHLHRVCGRLGIIGEKVTPAAAHQILLELLPKDDHVLYNFHIDMLRHGQRICVWSRPKCEQCLLTEICDWYQSNRK